MLFLFRKQGSERNPANQTNLTNQPMKNNLPWGWEKSKVQFKIGRFQPLFKQQYKCTDFLKTYK
jgi:hypothetical protein